MQKQIAFCVVFLLRISYNSKFIKDFLVNLSKISSVNLLRKFLKNLLLGMPKRTKNKNQISENKKGNNTAKFRNNTSY